MNDPIPVTKCSPELEAYITVMINIFGIWMDIEVEGGLLIAQIPSSYN